MSEWIDIEDELPKKSGRYLIYSKMNPHAHNLAAYCYPYPCCEPNIAYFTKDNKFWVWSSFEKNLPFPPTHWMSLPLPPES